MSDIIKNEDIVKAIDCKDEKYNPEDVDSLIYLRVFPYFRVPETQNDVASYVLMKVDVEDAMQSNNSFSYMKIVLWAMSHQDHMRMDNKDATRIDYIGKKLEEMLIGQTKYGYGILKLTSDREFVLNDKYQYRELTFRTFDANTDMCGVM